MFKFAKKFNSTICTQFTHIYLRLEKAAQWLTAHSIRPNTLTLAGIGFALIGLNFTAMEHYFSAFICFILNRLCDILDGIAARQSKPSLFGAFFDIFADYTSYALFIFGFILAAPQNNGPAGSFYLLTMIISAVSLLGFAMISGQNYRRLNESHLKICWWGTLQNIDNFAALFFMLILPWYFMPIAIFFGLLALGKSLLLLSSSYYKLEIAPKVKNKNETS